jgi:hypothetical protein
VAVCLGSRLPGPLMCIAERGLGKRLAGTRFSGLYNTNANRSPLITEIYLNCVNFEVEIKNEPILLDMIVYVDYNYM